MTVEYFNSELVPNIVDEQSCPFCHNSNFCGANRQENCWCFETKVPKALIELLPKTLSNKSCICAGCVKQYLSEPQQFVDQYLSK
jgi:hypothetical protein